jgi:hypothetical protein
VLKSLFRSVIIVHRSAHQLLSILGFEEQDKVIRRQREIQMAADSVELAPRLLGQVPVLGQFFEGVVLDHPVLLVHQIYLVVARPLILFLS